MTEAEEAAQQLPYLPGYLLQRGRLDDRGGGRAFAATRARRSTGFNGAASMTEAEDLSPRRPRSTPTSFNGAASMTEAEGRPRDHSKRKYRASTGRLDDQRGRLEKGYFMQLQRGRLDGGGGCCLCPWLGARRFNGAASMTEAEGRSSSGKRCCRTCFNGAASMTEAEGRASGRASTRRGCFNGAASMTEAEEREVLKALPHVVGASTGPPRRGRLDDRGGGGT